MIRFRASAWRMVARKKEASRLTVLGLYVAEGWPSTCRQCTGWERKADSTAKQRECQGLPVLAAATFSFWSVLWGLPARLSALAVPVRRTTLRDSSLLPCTLSTLIPLLCISSSWSAWHSCLFVLCSPHPSERVLYGPQNFMLSIRTLNYIYI